VETTDATRPKLLLATRNSGKVREYLRFLETLPIDVVTLDEAGIEDEVEETGDTILENAILKARTYAALSGMLTLADDSGLEVDALDGEPGVRSARYAGDGATAETRNLYLLQKLEAVPDDQLQARFRCVIAIATPDLQIETSEGTCEGHILREPRGSTGFGYDPIFYVPEYDRRMAELTMDEKNSISHRGKAMAGARPIVERLASQAAGAKS
jgi:XTP/dITP diphosphohydrolase